MTRNATRTFTYDDVTPGFPQSWNEYAYVGNQPLMFVDPLGTCATVKNHAPNGNSDDEASGEFGPFLPQNEMAAESADGGNIQQCLIYGSTSPWDIMDIDGAPVGYMGGGMGLADDLEYGGPDGTGSAVGAIRTYSIGSGLQTTAYQTDINGTPIVQPSAAVCQARIIADVDNQFGTSASDWGVFGGGAATGGEYNLTLTSSVLTPAQYNAVQLGRYASLATMITGIGSSLHIAGPTALDPGAFFSKTGTPGQGAVTITAHIDSGFAYNPPGLMIHFFGDVLGHATRDACPQ